MGNPLTGDFDAVLQVSGGTIDRLLASMHQNAGANAALPSFPHSVGFRLGEDHVIDGVKGALFAQVSVPRIDLIHGADDRFRLELGIRARYVPDPGTEPLAEFINGTLHAEYRLEDIDPNCRGWRTRAPDYLWFRVVDDSVSFHGTAADDPSFLVLSATLDEQDVIDRVTRQLRHLLKTRFAPAPQRVGKRFRRGSMRSLNVGIGHSAVAVPLGPPGGRLDSVDQVVLDGHDFGVALSAGYILAQVQPVLDQLKADFVEYIHFHSRTYIDLGWFGDVDVVTVDIDYTIRLTSAWAEWTGGAALGVSAGVITVHISGAARTEKSEYDVGFDVTQVVLVTFDASAEGIQLAAGGPPTVDVHYGGPHSDEVKASARPQIQSRVAGQVQGVLDQAAGKFDLGGQKVELINQLRTIDDQADAHFDGAEFSPDGAVLLGRIALAPRRRPVATFEKTAELNGYTAFVSWIPGGRIDAFEWSWEWSGNAGTPGSETDDDRFLLRRPPGRPTKFGYALELTTPLPGLDGWGSVCLTVAGSVVDPATGQLVPTRTGRKCAHYGWNVRIAGPPEVGRVLLRDVRHGSERGLVEVGGRGSADPAANTLVVYVGERFGEETAATLRSGLARCERSDAGLLVLVLFREGMLDGAGRDLGELGAGLEAPMLVSDDVRGRWSATLALRSDSGEPSWRLVSPNGGVTWMHDDALSGDELSHVLDDYLHPSAPSFAAPYRPGLGRVSPADFVDLLDTHCPPPPVGRLGISDSKVAFVHAGSAASDAKLRQLGRDGASIVAVVDGAGDDDARALGETLGESVVAIPDPSGAIADRFGVRYWPTTVTVNEAGMVTDHEVGAAAEDRADEAST